MLSPEDAPDDLGYEVQEECLAALAEREALAASAVQRALRRAAGKPVDDPFLDVEQVVEDLLDGHPDRHEAALELAPAFLDRGTAKSVRVALAIAGHGGAAAVHLVPRLRELAESSQPSWRVRIERCIKRRIEELER